MNIIKHRKTAIITVIVSLVLVTAVASTRYRTRLSQALFSRVDGSLTVDPKTKSSTASKPSRSNPPADDAQEKLGNEGEKSRAASAPLLASGDINAYVQTPAAVDRGTSDVGNPFAIDKKLRSPISVMPPAPPTATVARSSRIPQVVEMTIGGEESSETSRLLKSEGSPYSSAVSNNGERDRDRERSQARDEGRAQQGESVTTREAPDRTVNRIPREERLIKARSFKGDLRRLPRTRPPQRERREMEPPESNPTFYVPPGGGSPQSKTPDETLSPNLTANPPAPGPLNVFEGLDRFNWGAGSPPDTNGDVGPDYYIQTVNTSIGIFRKTDGFMEAAFTFNTFMSQGNFGNLCDTANFGDPVVLYDTFEDRWIITDFAFLIDGGGDALSPAFQCFAASQTGNPLTGGWNFYSRQLTDNLNDYPKFGIWPDGLYMSANMFGFGPGGTFQHVRLWAFNKAQMYAGSPTVKVVSFNVGGGDFTILPSNARLQTGTPPLGRPNIFLSTQLFLNALTAYKFHVDWNSISLSTLTGPDIPISATAWPSFAANVPQPGTAQLLDSLSNRAMMQNQYTNFGGTESLWVSHTVRRAAGGSAAPRWYQVNVNGGNVNPTIPQAATWDPDGANGNHRWMPSLALDRAGNLAMGYSISNNTTIFPSIRYAGRLAADPVNTFSQTEQTFFTGTASQTSSVRWGDYSAMTLDPDGCTFWYTTQYANPADQTFNHRWLTKFGSISAFPGCTPVGAGGTVSGTVTVNPGGAPISGATVLLGSGRSTTTDGSGNYSFTNIPAGTYPSMEASKPGFGSASALSIVVTDGNTTTQNFALTDAPDSACLTDTTQADFLTGVFTTVDLDTSPGDVTLNNFAVDQQNTAGTTTGTGFGTPQWTGQTFIPSVTGLLEKAEIQLFCNGCGATPPNLTLSVRNTAAGLPTGADLATVNIPGSAFASGGTIVFTATFGSPATLTSGSQYALILRPVAAPAGSGYFWIRSSPSTYASGSRVLSADSGGTWSADTTRDYNFKAYMRGPYSPASGNLISSPKDANPAPGLTPIWSTLSWNGSTPANTTLQFQVAGSNNVNGPFNFVGPDGTAGTFFTTSPASLGQFYGLRYLEYKAYLATTNNAVTPTLNDVTLCFDDVDCSGATPTITPTPAQVCDNSTGNTASGPAGMTSYSWSITNGTITSATNIQSITYTAGASGDVTLSLTITTPSGCIASSSVLVPINLTPATPTITPDGPTTFCAGGSVTLSSSSATGNQWYLNGNPIGGATAQQYVATTSGSYTTVVTNSGCSSVSSAVTTVTVNPIPPTPTVTPGGPTTFCDGGSVTLTSSSESGNQWYLNGNPIGGATGDQYVANTSGNYTVVVTAIGCPSAPSAGTTVTVTPIPATPTITPGGPTTFCDGGSVTLTSSSATGNQWYLNGNPIGGATSQQYVATGGGNYTTVVTTDGCSSSPSSATTVTVNPAPPMPTITPGGPTTFCSGGSVNLTSSSASGNQWYLNGNPIGGATAQQYSANGSGNYTVVVTALGCPSAPSTATTVTVNPIPSTPTITPSGSATFCPSGLTLTSSSASGNQWYLNGNSIGGATNQTYNATAAGSYTVVVTTNNCPSAASAATTLTADPAPVLTYPTPQSVVVGGSLNVNPTSASDNGPVTYSVQPGHGLTTPPTVNASGVVSITNAQPAGPHTIVIRATDSCGFIDASFSLSVLSPSNVTGTKTVAGTFVPGTSVTYTVTLSNSSASAQLDNPGNEFVDQLPASLTLVSSSATSGTATTSVGTNTVSWNGSIAGNGSVVITINATVNNVPHNTLVSNQGLISYDADGNGTNESNRTTDDPGVGGPNDPTNFNVVSIPDLTITKTHAGNFSGGQAGATYIIKVSNSSGGPTSGLVTVTDTLPVGLTPTGPNGVVNGWNCGIAGKTLTCTRNDVLAGNSSYPDIVLTVNVVNPAPLNVVNTATVAGGGEVNTANNTTSDPTAINCSPDFSLNNAGQLMISRFRSNGPKGTQDEFVEIYNPTNSPHTVASGNCGGGGYGVYASAGNGTFSNTANLVCYIPNGTVIPANGYYLCSGVTYSLANLGLNGGVAGATSVGDAPIGCNGNCTNDIPTDAGLALMNVAQAITLTPSGFDGGVPSAGFIIHDRVGFAAYGPTAPAPAYPSQAVFFCEGLCLTPGGDASTSAVCVAPTPDFPVVSSAPACYGQSGQYEYMRRQTPFSAQLGTQHQDSQLNGLDFLFISPNPASDTGKNISGLVGLTAVLGTASPHNSKAPIDAPPNGPLVKLPRSAFDVGSQLGPRNAERIYSPDPTVTDPANDPLGTFALRYKYVNNSGVPLTGMRFGVDDLSTLCGAQSPASVVGSGAAANAQSAPNCGAGAFTAILKVLNSTAEILIDSGGTVRVVNGLVIEDLSVGGAPGSGPLAPLAGGLDTNLVVNSSNANTSVGNGVSGGTGNFGITMGTAGPTNELNVKIKFGVVRSGRFILLLVPMAKTGP